MPGLTPQPGPGWMPTQWLRETPDGMERKWVHHSGQFEWFREP